MSTMWLNIRRACGMSTDWLNLQSRFFLLPRCNREKEESGRRERWLAHASLQGGSGEGFVAERASQNLADIGLRQDFAEDDVSRHFVGGEALTAPSAHHIFGEVERAAD